MSSFTTCLRPISKVLARQYKRSCFPNRLMFRSSKLLSSDKTPCQVYFSIRCLATDTELQIIHRMDAPQNIFESSKERGGNGFWLERVANHSVLENDPAFQPTIFTANGFEEYVNNQCKSTTSSPTIQDFLHASAQDISGFICHQAPIMGREDFRESCNNIAEQLPRFSDDDLLIIFSSLHTLRSQGGNTSTIFQVLDKELVARYLGYSYDSSKNCFFLRITDVLFWLNLLDRSSFADKFLRNTIKSSSVSYILWPHGVQIMFYATCQSWLWRSKVEVGHLLYFLNNIKHECTLTTFLVAIECFSVLHYVRRTMSKSNISLPPSLLQFLLCQALENVSSDVLRSVTQFMYTCSVRSVPYHLFLRLLDKISESGQSTNFLVVYYILHIMSKCKIKHEKFIKNLNSTVIFHQANMQVIPSMFLNLYGELGQHEAAQLAKTIAPYFENGDLPHTSEGLLLKVFVTLMDAGIPLFCLWEITMQGDVMVPNFNTEREKGGANRLHLIADDCIEVNCPQYTGSRLTDALRMQLYFENSCSNDVSNKHSFFRVFRALQQLSNGQVLTGHVLPGFSCPGLADIIVCVGSNNVFIKPTHMSNTCPWRVKKIPSQNYLDQDCTFIVVWACPPYWPTYYVKLKEQTLKKLGYVSLKIEQDFWSLPEECMDNDLHSFFSKFARKRTPANLYPESQTVNYIEKYR